MPSPLLVRRQLTTAKSQAWLPVAVTSVCCHEMSALPVCHGPCLGRGPPGALGSLPELATALLALSGSWVGRLGDRWWRKGS